MVPTTTVLSCDRKAPKLSNRPRVYPGKVMKSKVQHQIQPGKLNSAEQAQAEINRFLQAVDSYPSHAAKEAHLSFRQHLSRFFVADQNTNNKNCPRRH
jgi:hypothetical protein